MNQILPYSLWIGTSGDVRDLRRLYQTGIRAVVQVAYEEPPLALPHDIIACRFPLIDGDENPADLLSLAINTLVHLLKQKIPTLVCCQAGLSRSPAVVAAAMTRLTHQRFADCVANILQHHRCDIHAGLLAQFQSLCDSPKSS